MRTEFSLGRFVGQALEANLRYITLATSVANSVADAAFANLSADQSRTVTTAAKRAQPKQLTLPPQPQAPPAAILLEGAAGSTPTALFLLANYLPHEVEASVEISPLTTPSGRKLKSTLQFDKRTIVLAAGQQVVAKITAPITTKLVLGEHYTGEIRVRGIPGATVPLGLRRIPDPVADKPRRSRSSIDSSASSNKAKPSRRPRAAATITSRA